MGLKMDKNLANAGDYASKDNNKSRNSAGRSPHTKSLSYSSAAGL